MHFGYRGMERHRGGHPKQSNHPSVFEGRHDKNCSGSSKQSPAAQNATMGTNRGGLTRVETGSGDPGEWEQADAGPEPHQTMVVTRSRTYEKPTESVEESPPGTPKEEPLRKSRATRPKSKLWLRPDNSIGTPSAVAPTPPDPATQSSQSPTSVQAAQPPMEEGGDGTYLEEENGPNGLMYPLPANQRIALSVRAAQWPSVKRNGKPADESGRVFGYGPSLGPPPQAEIVVEIHYARCLKEGIYFYRDP